MFEAEGKLGRTPRLNTKILLIAAGIIIVILAAIAGFFIWRTISLSQNPNQANQQKTSDIVSKVSKLYAVPESTPTLAQITNRDKLDEQEFFKKAQNGDYLLVYTSDKLAIIYRESDNKIINSGPIDPTGAEAAQ